MGDIDIYPYPESNNGVTDIAQQASAPVVPDIGDLWLDTDENAGAGLSSIIGYAEKTTTTAGIAGVVDLAGLSVTVTVPAGRRIRITGYSLFLKQGGPGYSYLKIKEGATTLNGALFDMAAGEYMVLNPSVVLSPSAGTHTYKLTAEAEANTTDQEANPNFPAYILVEDITGTLWPVGQSISSGMLAPDPWTPYTPVWSSSGTQPAIGNGILTGRYARFGRLVVGNIYVQMGATTSYGTGTYFWSLPFIPYTASSGWVVLGVMKGYQGGNSINTISRVYNSTNTLQLVYSGTWPAGAETSVGQTLPWTWTTGGNMDIHFAYEAAS